MVKRYDVGAYGDIREDAEGGYVRLDDYLAIVGRLDEREKALIEANHLAIERGTAIFEYKSKLFEAESRLDSCEERFQAARDAYDVLFVESIGDKDAAHRTLVEALAGVKFVKPTAEDLEACRRDLIQAGIVERRETFTATFPPDAPPVIVNLGDPAPDISVGPITVTLGEIK